MVNLLNTLDVRLFRFFNSEIHNPIFDLIMPLITDLNAHRIVLFLVAVAYIWMLVKGNRQLRIALLLLPFTILFSDQLSSFVIKHIFERPRPCHALQNVRLLVGCGSGFSFPSSHAVNNCAAALVLAYFIPRGIWWFFGFASLVGFSRIYVGVHYPLDVLGGGIIGLCCGSCIICIYLGLEYLWFSKIHRIQMPE
jgi:undecaprenyl-diphosphatase